MDKSKSSDMEALPELRGEIEWFTDLRTAIVEGKTDDALAAIDAALKMLRRNDDERRNIMPTTILAGSNPGWLYRVLRERRMQDLQEGIRAGREKAEPKAETCGEGWESGKIIEQD